MKLYFQTSQEFSYLLFEVTFSSPGGNLLFRYLLYFHPLSLCFTFYKSTFFFPWTTQYMDAFYNLYFFLWNNFFSGVRSILVLREDDHKNLIISHPFSYHPQSTRKHRSFLHLSFLFINFRFCQYNKNMMFMFIFSSVFYLRCLYYKNNLSFMYQS